MRRRKEKSGGKLRFLEQRLSQVLLEIDRTKRNGSDPLLTSKLEEESSNLLNQKIKVIRTRSHNIWLLFLCTAAEVTFS